MAIYMSYHKREMQSACSQLWFSGFYCAKRTLSTICGQLDGKKPKQILKEEIHMGPTIQPTGCPSVLLSAEASIY